MVENNSSLKGKSREEMDLKKFEDVEIRLIVIGVDVIITQKTIAKLLKALNSSRFVVNTKENNSEADAIKRCLFDNAGNLCSSDFGKVKNMHNNFKLLFKILIGCMIPREGSTDQILLDHKHFIFYLKNEDKINLSAYIFNHLREDIKEAQSFTRRMCHIVNCCLNYFIRVV